MGRWQKVKSFCQDPGSRRLQQAYVYFMNTLCDTVPKGLQQNDCQSEHILPTERTGQLYRRILVGTDFSAASTAAF